MFYQPRTVPVFSFNRLLLVTSLIKQSQRLTNLCLATPWTLSILYYKAVLVLSLQRFLGITHHLSSCYAEVIHERRDSYLFPLKLCSPSPPPPWVLCSCLNKLKTLLQPRELVK